MSKQLFALLTTQRSAVLLALTVLFTVTSPTTEALASAAQTGFKNGNKFEYKSAVGDVSVHCPNTGGSLPGGPSGPTFANYRCYGYSLTPGDADYFVGPKVNADEVELIAVRADGSKRSKTGEYESAKGQSKDTFNLWIETLFQKPLLKMGRNDVTWNLKRGGRTVQTGSFIAEVFDRGDLRCPAASETSWDPSDCQNSGRICSDYFFRYGNQCR
ncbi:MAG: hypothetical protein U1E10_12285 [Bdellovibrionales bacterium]|nr:hypothetical protein [Bdellovibrionales bacterium]